MLKSKWHMHRMGLVDFWYYVNEEFFFKNGHMLLRGSNGSGKSVTMQSFIPLLLDGNKSSERLDSFGTRSRKIENYLLEEDDDRNDRIGYLYLEFKREDSDIFKTIGMGLHARRNKPVDAWYFVIEDNRRINHELSLMENNLAITKLMLKNQIGSQLIDTQKEYMDHVNRALFNFPSRDDYKETINLLMQLRSPKLSNSLKPTMINEILSDSLQPLSEDDLRPMSEAIANMDEIKDQLDALKQSFTAAKNIDSIFEQYNYASLDRKAMAYLKEEEREQALLEDLHVQESLKETSLHDLKDAKEQKAAVQLEQDVLNEELRSLVKKDLIQLVQEVGQHKQDLDEQQQTFHLKRDQLEEKEDQAIDVKQQVKTFQEKSECRKAEIQHVFHELCELQEAMQFEEHTALQQEMMINLEQEYDMSYPLKKIKEEISALQEGLRLFDMVDNEKTIVDNFMNEKENQELEIEKIETELQEYEQQFSAIQEEYKERFSIWNKKNQYLSFNNDQMLTIYDKIQSFEEEDTYHAIDEMIHQAYFVIFQKLSKQLSQLEIDKNAINNTLLETHKELDVWKNLQDPSPQQDEFVTASRTFLTGNQIPARPFYTLLEYDDSIAEQMRNTFEEQLMRIGLLNALVVNHSYREQILQMPNGMADQFLFVDRDVEHLAILKITQRNDRIDLNGILQQLGVEQTTMTLLDHSYQHGALTGIVSCEMKSIFIGQMAREAYRRNKIIEIEAKLQNLQNEAMQLQLQYEEVMQKRAVLDSEFHGYPSKSDLETAKADVRKIEQQRQPMLLVLQRMLQQISVHEDKIRELYLRITTISGHLGITAQRDVFQGRKNDFEAYEKQLNQLKSEHQQYLSSCELWQSASSRLEFILSDLDTLRYEYTKIKGQIEKLELLIKQKEQQLAEQGYQDVKNRIEEIQVRCRMIPNVISDLDSMAGKLQMMIETCQTNLLSIQADLQNQVQRKEQNKSYYMEELTLGYVLKDMDHADAKQVRKEIHTKFSNLKAKDVLGNDLQTSFYTNRGYLQEYGLNIFSLFDQGEEGVSRLDITARYKGKRIPFTQLLENLQKDIEQQSVLLEDSDRVLIEDILINTISRKIRIHIQNSRRWVDIMNRYMTSMDTSSGLKLSLQWKSHQAENEEELSSENLVKLLEKDIRILKESDLKHLSSHFRSKIMTARRLSEQQDNNESFHQIMKKVMDYRCWFDFRIQYEKTGGKKKELTNNAFYAFSGGEKAMSMYVPLFSAVAAKFEGAEDDAPLLIALDEAFAGVDEKNISNMFELIAKFHFDYIMNSQVLWGDYPSVSSLAIHELFRPENAKYVTVISYEWNGQQKSLVHHA